MDEKQRMNARHLQEKQTFGVLETPKVSTSALNSDREISQ